MDEQRNDTPVPDVGQPLAESDSNPLAERTQSGTAERTAEEQMAQFEEELKTNDWGHQPC